MPTRIQKDVFLQSLALPGPCERREMAISTNNGMGWYTTCLCSFSPWAAEKLGFPKLIFFDIVTTHNDHPSHVIHVLGSMYVVSTLFGYLVCGGFSQWTGTQPAYAVFHPVLVKIDVSGPNFF